MFHAKEGSITPILKQKNNVFFIRLKGSPTHGTPKHGFKE
jgi:hypothetical protein